MQPFRSIVDSDAVVFSADSPSRSILDQIADKWSTMSVLDKPRRYNQINRRLEGRTPDAQRPQRCRPELVPKITPTDRRARFDRTLPEIFGNLDGLGKQTI